MLSILGSPRSACDALSRRNWIQVAGSGLLGLSLPKVLAAQAASDRPPRARSVIFLFLFGGPSQLETFDMKPEAPDSIRGPFQPIGSRTPGLLICEHLHRLAGISDKFCVARTVTHDYNDHSGAGHYIQTGQPWHIPIGGGFSRTPEDWPSLGSVVEFLDQNDPHSDRQLPSYAVVPNSLGRLQDKGQYRRPGEYAGWLGRTYNPLTTRVDKRDQTDNPYFRDCTDRELTFEVSGMTLDEEITLDRLQRRVSLRRQLERAVRTLDARPLPARDRFSQQALRLVTSPAIREALDIRREPDGMRDRYGRHLFGQSALMARRLVEAGARFVTVHYDAVDGYSWDSHTHSEDVENYLLPTLDQALAALLTDLDQRGLLSETLVVAMGEMGRTPKANDRWGRGHWSTLFPAVLAGAGIRGGIVYGTSDSQAAEPVDHPIRPEDLAATIYDALGIDPQMRLTDALGRPVPIARHGRPLRELFG